MNLPGLAIGLAHSAWVLFDITLLLALIGVGTSDRHLGDRILACLAILTIACAANAYAVDQFARL